MNYSKPNVVFFETKNNITIRVHEIMSEWVVETFHIDENGFSSMGEADSIRRPTSAEAVELAKELIAA